MRNTVTRISFDVVYEVTGPDSAGWEKEAEKGGEIMRTAMLECLHRFSTAGDKGSPGCVTCVSVGSPKVRVIRRDPAALERAADAEGGAA